MSSPAAPSLSDSQTTPRSSSAVLPSESSNHLSSESAATLPHDDETTIPYTKKYHRIFKPRSRPYSREEYKLINSLSPLHGLPICLFPTEEEPRPPLMHYGWLLPESVISGLLQRAEAKNELCYASIAVEPTRVVRFVNESTSMELVVDDMIKDLQLNIPLRQYINLVFTSTTESGTGFCLTVITNHVMGKLPTDKEIRTLAEHIGLTQLTPLWYPSAIRFEWEY